MPGIHRGENNEVDQTRPELEGVLMDGTVNHMRYKLPEITCDHAILMMRYREYSVTQLKKRSCCLLPARLGGNRQSLDFGFILAWVK